MFNLTAFTDLFYSTKKPGWIPPSSVNHALTGAFTWEELCEALTIEPTITKVKEACEAFSLCLYKTFSDEGVDTKVKTNGDVVVRHSKKNAITYDAAVIDFDGGITIDEFKKQYADWKYVAFTTWSHKHSEKKKFADCFRVVVPLSRPVDAVMWSRMEVGLLGMFKHCDVTSFEQGRMFFRHSCPKETKHLAQTWINDGSKIVDVDSVPLTEPVENKVYTPPVIPPNAVVGGTGRIMWTTVNYLEFARAVGLHPVNAGGGWYEVECPWGHEHGGDKRGAFVTENGFHCKHGHGQKVIPGQRRTYAKSNEQFKAHFRELMGDDAFRPYVMTEEPTPEPVVQPIKKAVPYNREKRSAMIVKRFVPLKHQRSLVYAREGFGKSTLTPKLVANGHHVVFACDGNDQVREKAESFQKLGLTVQAIYSRAHLLKRDYHIDAVMDKPLYPWLSAEVNEKKTKLVIKEQLGLTKTEIDAIWLTTTSPALNRTVDVVVMTHDRAILYERLQQEAHRKDHSRYRFAPKTVVFYDDPGMSDFVRLFVWQEQWEEAFQAKMEKRRQRKAKLKKTEVVYDNDPMSGPVVDDEEVERMLSLPSKVTIDGVVYGQKPLKAFPGYEPTTYKVIITTTELVTTMLIKRLYPDVYCPDDMMPDEQIDCGPLAIYSTPIVRKKQDGMLPLMIERIKGVHDNVNYYGDGSGVAWNLVNNKGRNDLTGSHSVIKISQPHYDAACSIAREFGEDDSAFNKYAQLISLDKLHQAIGRNGGYRRTDSKTTVDTVVLVEPNLYQYIVDNCQYAADETVKMGVEKNRVPIVEAGTVRDMIKGMISNPIQYVVGGKALADLPKAIKNAKSAETFAKRLTFAIAEALNPVNGTCKLDQTGIAAFERLNQAVSGHLRF